MKTTLLRTQRQRSAFIRKAMREKGITVKHLSELTGHMPTTIHNFIQDITKDPRTSTTMNIFYSMGFNVEFVKDKKHSQALSSVG